MRRLAFFFLLVFSLAAQAQKPLREADILKELASGTNNKQLVTLVRDSGVDFSLTPENEERLRTLGADDELIAAIRAAAAARGRPAAEAPKPALAEPEILKGLAGGMSNRKLAALVSRYGVDFSLTPESEDRLRSLGADDELLAAIRKSKPTPKTPAPEGRKVNPKMPAPGETKVNPRDGLPYVWILPGTFQMGCLPGYGECLPQEGPPHTVTITKGFWIGKTEVTQAAYQRVTGKNPSLDHGDHLPVQMVTWDDANSYCSAVGMRLPTEAEWEYAARAGSTAFRNRNLDAAAWYDKNSGDRAHEVGQKQGNAWGLYDLLGNQWEFVADWFGYYSHSPSRDPQGPPAGQYRVLRGGSFSTRSALVRVSSRGYYDPGSKFLDYGFRCVGEVP